MRDEKKQQHQKYEEPSWDVEILGTPLIQRCLGENNKMWNKRDSCSGGISKTIFEVF